MGDELDGKDWIFITKVNKVELERFGESTASPFALLTFMGRKLPQEASTVESNQNSSVSVLADPP